MPNDSSHRISESSGGKLVDVSSLTVGAQAVERQRIVIADDADADGIASVHVHPCGQDEPGLAVRPIFDPAMSAAFGALRVVPEEVVSHLQFPYNINARLVTTTTANGGTVTQADAHAVLQTSAAANGSAQLVSKAAIRYAPGQGVMCRFTAVWNAPAANSLQEVGIGDDTDGFFFGYNGLTFGVLRRQNGTPTWVAQADWNADKCDGTGHSGMVLDQTKGYPYQIQFQWLGYGAINFFVENPATGALILVHQIRYAGTAILTSIYNPTLPLHVHVENTGNTSNLTLRVPSMSLLREGPLATFGLRNAKSNRKTGITTTETNVIAIKVAPTFASKTNRVRVLVDYLAYAVEPSGSADGLVRLVLNPTLGGSPSYSDIDANTSVVQFDVAGTTVTGGYELLNFATEGQVANTLDLSKYEFRLAPGDILVAAVASTTGTVAARLGFGWREEF